MKNHITPPFLKLKRHFGFFLFNFILFFTLSFNIFNIEYKVEYENDLRVLLRDMIGSKGFCRDSLEICKNKGLLSPSTDD